MESVFWVLSKKKPRNNTESVWEQLNGYNSELPLLIYEIYILILSLVFRGLTVSGHLWTLKGERHCAYLVFTKTVWNMIYIDFIFWNYRCLHVFLSRILSIFTYFS